MNDKPNSSSHDGPCSTSISLPHSNSRQPSSKQNGIHEKLPQLVHRHLSSPFRKPILPFNIAAFETAQEFIARHNKPLILDSCCGVGESTYQLARQHPDAVVIGIDKSANRIGKHTQDQENYLLLRADLNDFWRLAVEAKWQLQHHYLLYPNPWPKAAHIQRRWHGSALFPSLLALGGILEVRSNWQIYIEEFALALKIAGIQTQVEHYQTQDPITPFERKYQQSGHALWRCCAQLAAHSY